MRDKDNRSHLTKEKIHNFFEHPKTLFSRLIQAFIVLLIIFSVSSLVIEYWYTDLFYQYDEFFKYSEYLVLAVFTIEYLLRFFSAPNKLQFSIKPLNIVDFAAVFPAYLEFILPLFLNTSAIRGLRIIRLLRFARILRAFRLFRYGHLLKSVLKYQDTILQSIIRVVLLFVALKSIIWILEYNHFWMPKANIGELLTIIGFSLGIILSQKIASTYSKFLQVDETIVHLHGTLVSLSLILDKGRIGPGEKTCKRWAQEFIRILEDENAENHEIHIAHSDLYNALSQLEDTPAEMAGLHVDICRDAAFCLTKKTRLTPKPYDTLLHQSTMLYLFLLSVFIPGITGLFSVLIATYILYGMYNLTQDFDSIFGGEFQLINIDISGLKRFANDD
jgi:hypothetical protein